MAKAPDGRKVGPRPATLDRLKKKKAIHVPHLVLLDNDVARVLTEARTALDKAERDIDKLRALVPLAEGKDAHDAKVAEAERALAEAGEAYNLAREEAAEATVELRLKAVPGHELDRLSRKHQVTDEDREQLKADGLTDDQIDAIPHSPSTWPPVVIAATVDDPKMTPEQVRELIWENDEWNAQEREDLLRAVTGVNNGRGWVDLGNAYGGGRTNATSKPSPTASADLGASSSDESGPTP